MGEFIDGVTVLCGANGSGSVMIGEWFLVGKSTILEAISFVFGYSSKNLRSKSLFVCGFWFEDIGMLVSDNPDLDSGFVSIEFHVGELIKRFL